MLSSHPVFAFFFVCFFIIFSFRSDRSAARIRMPTSTQDKIRRLWGFVFSPAHPEVKDYLVLKSRGWVWILTFLYFRSFIRAGGAALFLYNSCTCSSGTLDDFPSEFIIIEGMRCFFIFSSVQLFFVRFCFFMLLWPEGSVYSALSDFWFLYIYIFFPPTTQMTHGKENPNRRVISTKRDFSGQASERAERRSVRQDCPRPRLLLQSRLNRESPLPETTRCPGGFLSGRR